jgi:hypothetical protein
MSEKWVGVVVSIVGLLVPIARLWLEPLIARRMEEFTNRSTQRSPAFDHLFPFGTVQSPQTDVARAQRWLKWATVIMPLATLVYGLFDVRVGPNYFHMSPVLGSVIALLFTAIITPLIGWVGVGSRRAIGVAAKVCNVYEWIFVFFATFFLFVTVTALTRVFGITYFAANVDNPVLTTFLVGILAALSALVWQATKNSAALLRSLLLR